MLLSFFSGKSCLTEQRLQELQEKCCKAASEQPDGTIELAEKNWTSLKATRTSHETHMFITKKKKTIRTGKQVKKNEVWNLLEHSSLLMDKNSSSTKSTPMRIEWKKVKVNIKNSSIIPCNFFWFNVLKISIE